MAHFYTKYLDRVTETDLHQALIDQSQEFLAFLQQIPEAESQRLHPPYTWTLRQVIGHMIDSERIFAYRALRLARGDQTALPGYDENAYSITGQFEDRPLATLIAEWQAVRQATVLLVTYFPPGVWENAGDVNGTRLNVRELIQAIIGHIRHHHAIMINRLYPNSH